MKIISHRGNIDGVISSKENSPEYIDTAINLGYDVEVDIRFINGKFWLGHDTPDYSVNTEWISHRKKFLWFHCKDLYSATELTRIDSEIIKFCHKSDSFVLVSNGTVWVHDLNLKLDDLSVIPLLSMSDIQNYDNNKEVYGICTDFPKIIKKNKN